jgi:hypothetical protein
MQMKKLLPVLALLACAATGVSAILPTASPAPAAPVVAKATVPVTGDYVEARTASVFAGACHYNGELVTVGKDAVLAWNFSSGSFNGTDLSGIKAVASVTSDDSLGNPGTRKAELAFDPAASDAQVAAATALIHSKAGKNLGTIVATRRTPITFTHTDEGYTVTAKDFASLTVAPRADASCCVQPHLVWFEPLTPLQSRKVGYTTIATSSSKVSDPWTRTAEDSAFYGSFTF